MPATLSVEQLDQLTTSFTVNSFPSKQDRQLLSTLVGMTEAKVNAWFTSQRTVEGVRKPVKIQLVDLEKAVRIRCRVFLGPFLTKIMIQKRISHCLPR